MSDRRGSLRRLTAYVLSHYRFSCLTVALCIVVTAVTTLVSTLFTRTLIDDYIAPLMTQSRPDYGPLAASLTRLAAVLAVGVLCAWAHNRLMINVTQGTMRLLRTDLFNRMQRLPVAFFDRRPHGDIMSTYTNDVDSLRQMIGQSLPQAFNSIITLTVTLVSMVALSVPLTVVSVVMAAVMMWTTTRLGRRSRAHFKVQQHKLAEANGFIEEMLSGQRVVKVFCHEDEAIGRFEDINEQLRAATFNANRIGNIVMPVNGNLGHLAYVLIAVTGATLILWEGVDLTLGTLVAFLTLNKSFARPIAGVSQQINNVLNAAVGADRVFSLMDEPAEDDRGDVRLVNAMEADDGTLVPTMIPTGVWAWYLPGDDNRRSRFVRVNGLVELRGVDFGYRPDKQVLFGINLTARPGMKVAFVGGTGAGKTTITNLINRFYDIGAGHIAIDGIDVRHIAKRHLRHALGMVLQDTHLFTGTVMDNIRYGRLDASDQDCIEAAKLVNADNFIRRLSDGYRTVLDGDGGNLSQGERQLLAIARAAVADPPVLILDEATSSVDTRTERLVQQGMDSLMRGRTTFVIAHRLSTVRNADLIVVLEHGRIIEQGSHRQLLDLGGKYRQLYMGREI